MKNYKVNININAPLDASLSYEDKLPYVVGRAFVRICKQNGLYPIMKKRTNDFVVKSHHSMVELFEEYARSTFKELPELRKENPYEHIAICTNKLLHDFVDDGKDPQLFENVGREIFNLSSYIIFGQQFLNDMARQPQMDAQSFEAFCHDQYNMVKNSAARGMSYKDFVEHYNGTLHRIFQSMHNHRKR